MLHVLSLGGSLFSLADGLNLKFLKEFKKLIIKRVALGDKFIIVVGGGALARSYIKVAGDLNPSLTDENKDYLGIDATIINANLFKMIFSELARPQLLSNPNKKERLNKALNFSGGYKPGASTDFVTARLAKTYQVDTIVNLSNIDYVYDRDPNKFPEAQVIKKMRWSEFLNISGDKWSAGLNLPFDPIASKFCQKNNKKVIILNGRNIRNLENYFLNKKFKGTVIY
ncbi:MAG: UMP kinase [Patescibacteria group bacterium]|jgi:uridylate kinase|nr:UMP kinase [Patescibacteria group bacterium]